MRISTKRGDKGNTSLLNGTRVPKNDSMVEFLGTVDELQAFIGVSELNEEVKPIIQRELYEIMSGNSIDPWFDTNVDHDGQFSISDSWLNVARTICRRAERRAVTAGCKYAIPYLNRLSDYLYKVDYEQG